MLWTILLLILAAIAGILIFAAMRPDSFRIARSIDIEAPPAKVFPLIEEFREWTKWSPYEKLDPNMKRSFGAVTRGAGAHYAWEGDKKVGAGSMDITSSKPSSEVSINLNMIKPFAANNKVTFTVAPRGSGSTVTWTMEGASPLMMRVMHLFMNIDKMVGGQFDEGLQKMKAAAES
jgi:Polyketide cyclase / dehydrase and lipid transport